MRLLHTSDWHLDRQLLGLSLYDDHVQMCDQLIDLTHDVRPDLVIILGDLFERPTPSEAALQLLDHVLQRLLLECKVRVLLAPGQHDGIRRLSFGAWLYERKQLHLVTNLEQALSPILLEDADGPVHVNAIPYIPIHEIEGHFRGRQIRNQSEAGSAIMEHLTRFRRLRRRAVRGLVAGYLHVAGGQTSGEERPSDGPGVLPAGFDGMDYAALGYLHHYQVLGEQKNLCYSGSPMHFRFEKNPQPRGVVRVELNGEGQASQELIPLTPRREFLRFQGSLERLLMGPDRSTNPEDLVVLELSEDSDLLNAELLLRLRDLYPNLWRIERPGSAQRLFEPTKFEPVQSFEHFFASTTGAEIAPEQRDLLREIFSDLTL